jgi:hypothetical protein
MALCIRLWSPDDVAAACIDTAAASAAAAAAAVCRAHFQRRPTYSAHLLANKLFDQDNVRQQHTHQAPVDSSAFDNMFQTEQSTAGTAKRL